MTVPPIVEVMLLVGKPWDNNLFSEKSHDCSAIAEVMLLVEKPWDNNLFSLFKS